MTEESSYQNVPSIDVDAIFQKKNPRVYSMMPNFVLDYVKRTIHQDEINHALTLYRDDLGLDFVARILEFLGVRYSVSGEENIPLEGRHIFVSNHPLGGVDGMIFLDLIGRYHKNVKFIVNDLLLNLKNLEPVFVPVNKHGRQSVEYVKRIEELYRSDAQVLYFPAGLCSRKRGGKITDVPWKKNFIKKAIEHQRDVVPAHFDGENSSFFYRLANLRQMAGIRSNIEMFYLPDEMFRQKGRKINLTIGKPIPWSTFDKSMTHSEWTDYVRGKVYELRKSATIPS